MTRLRVTSHGWHQPRGVRRAFLELTLNGARIFGVHLSAVHSNWTERWRMREVRALLDEIGRRQHGFHVLAGDFNTLAPGASLDLARLPPRLRALAWVSGGPVRWHTVQMLLDARYVDVFRLLHPEDAGFTFPTTDPHVRLDYVFAPAPSAGRVSACTVYRGAACVDASDHFPLVSEIDLG
jgi:exodeoxyribonuclease-3